jgi:hypothetical protein
MGLAGVSGLGGGVTRKPEFTSQPYPYWAFSKHAVLVRDLWCQPPRIYTRVGGPRWLYKL